jgi:hypothetical protein
LYYAVIAIVATLFTQRLPLRLITGASDTPAIATLSRQPILNRLLPEESLPAINDIDTPRHE